MTRWKSERCWLSGNYHPTTQTTRTRGDQSTTTTCGQVERTLAFVSFFVGTNSPFRIGFQHDKGGTHPARHVITAKPPYWFLHSSYELPQWYLDTVVGFRRAYFCQRNFGQVFNTTRRKRAFLIMLLLFLLPTTGARGLPIFSFESASGLGKK